MTDRETPLAMFTRAEVVAVAKASAEIQNRCDPVVESVRSDLLARSRAGLLKYGVGLDRADLTLRDWLQHAYEECLDQANYLKRAIMELNGYGKQD